MVRRARMFIHDAIDLWLGELARQGKALATREKYRSVLDPFGETVRHKSPAEVEIDDCRAWLNLYVNHSLATQALYVTVIRRFFAFLEDEGIVPRSPADRLKRPLRKRPEDVDVVTITPQEAAAMLRACEDWQELLCIGVLAYTGVRRKAAADARRRDANLDAGTIKFTEKGGKVDRKPLADELLTLLRRADELGQWRTGDDWLIPNRRPASVKSRSSRSDKVIYETVLRVADRAGIRSHVHAFRGAFAVAFDDAHPDHGRALQDYLGHVRPETTNVYLRRRNKGKAMEVVRDLSFGFSESVVKAHTGFEPVLPAEHVVEPVGREHEDVSVADVLLARARVEADLKEPSRREVET